jgi:chromosome segregation ATPase
MLAKLNANLEEQINQNTELSETIVRYMEKEAKMKETLAVLERESQEIFTLVQEKEQNEETYQKAIEELQEELLSLRNQQSSPTHSK